MRWLLASAFLIFAFVVTVTATDDGDRWIETAAATALISLAWFLLRPRDWSV